MLNPTRIIILMVATALPACGVLWSADKGCGKNTPQWQQEYRFDLAADEDEVNVTYNERGEEGALDAGGFCDLKQDTYRPVAAEAKVKVCQFGDQLDPLYGCNLVATENLEAATNEAFKVTFPSGKALVLAWLEKTPEDSTQAPSSFKDAVQVAKDADADWTCGDPQAANGSAQEQAMRRAELARNRQATCTAE